MPFNLKHAKTFIGKTVNLHLTDGATILNVRVLYIINRQLTYKAPENKFAKAWPKPKPETLPLHTKKRPFNTQNRNFLLNTSRVATSKAYNYQALVLALLSA
jgi:hypothetical protein